MTEEAKLEPAEHGLVPTPGDGWFVLNAADAPEAYAPFDRGGLGPMPDGALPA